MKLSEKAKELVEKIFFTIVDAKNEQTLKLYWKESKQCALICVDEQDEILQLLSEDVDDLPLNEYEIEQVMIWIDQWKMKIRARKQEIEKL